MRDFEKEDWPLFEYKGKQYWIESNTEMKDSVLGWIEAVNYISLESGHRYTSSRERFELKFKEIK